MAHLPDALLALTFRHPCLFVSALWRIFLMRFWRSLSGIRACNPNPFFSLKGCVCLGGSKAELLKISRKADRIAPSPLNPNKVKYKIYQQFGVHVNAVGDNYIFLILSIILVIGSSLFEPIIISAADLTSSCAFETATPRSALCTISASLG